MRSLGRLDASVSIPYKINHLTLFGHRGSSSVHPCEANDNFKAQIIHSFMEIKLSKCFHPKNVSHSHSSFTFFQKWFLLLKTTTTTTTTIKLKDKTNVFSMVIDIMLLNLYWTHIMLVHGGIKPFSCFPSCSTQRHLLTC